MNIEIPLERLLERQGRSFYWLAKQTGVSYTTLWRLKSGKALGITFATLAKICDALGCTPGDVLTIEQEKRKPERTSSNTRRQPGVRQSRI
jgi:putative transcriptional regulator